MIISSRAIVLSKVKFGDSSLILKVLSEKYGIQTFIIKGIYSKRSKISPAVLQPCSLVEYVSYYFPEKNLQRLTDIRLADQQGVVYLPIEKATILIFLSEILSKSLWNEPQPHPELFAYVWDSFSYFLLSEDKTPNFHLIFLIQTASHLGFSIEESHPEWLPILDQKTLENFKQPLNGQQRSDWLQQIIQFYQEHILEMKEIKSLKILQQVFA